MGIAADTMRGIVIPLLGSRYKRLIAAVVSGMGARSVALITPFLVTPVILHYFGDAAFGVWITSISVTSMAVFADLGIGNGLMTRIANAFGRGDNDGIRAYVASGYAVLSAVAVCLLSVSLLFFLLVDVPHSQITLSILVVFVVGLPASVFHHLLYGIQKVPLSNLIVALGACLSLVASLLAVHLNAELWTVSAAYSLPPVLLSFGGAILFFLRHPQFRPNVGMVKHAHVRDLLSLSSRFFILSILTAVGLNVDNTIISFNVGPEAVAAYSIPSRLGSVLGLLILTLSMPVWGANGEALARHEYGWVGRNAWRMSLFGSVIVLISGGLLVALSNNIMLAWIGRVFPEQHIILILVVATSAIIAATSPYNMILNALGLVSSQIWPWFIFVALSIPLKLYLVTAGQLWFAAAITGALYAVVISPVMLVVARSNLQKFQEGSGSTRVPDGRG